MQLGPLPMPSLPIGWFTRQVRKILEKVWANEYAKLGTCDRERCRHQGWLKVTQLPWANIWAHVQQAYISAESDILRRNQYMLSKRIRDARLQDPQLSFIGMAQNRLHAQLLPIKEKFVRKPGSDHSFGELVKVRDLDFITLSEMADVRVDNVDECIFALVDYQYIDKVRLRLGAPATKTLGQVFNF